MGVEALFVHAHQSQCVSANNVSAEDEANSLSCLIVGFLLADSFIFLVPNSKEAFTASQDIIHHQVNAVNTGNSQDSILFIIKGASAVLSPDFLQLTPKNLRQEIAIAAGRLQKATVNTLCFLFYEVKHGVDFTLSGEHLAVIGNPFLRFDLLFHVDTNPFSGNLIHYSIKEQK